MDVSVLHVELCSEVQSHVTLFSHQLRFFVALFSVFAPASCVDSLYNTYYMKYVDKRHSSSSCSSCCSLLHFIFYLCIRNIHVS